MCCNFKHIEIFGVFGKWKTHLQLDPLKKLCTLTLTMSTTRQQLQLLAIRYTKKSISVTIPKVIPLLIAKYSDYLESWTSPIYISENGQTVTQKTARQSLIHGSFLIEPSNLKKESYIWSITISGTDRFGFGLVSANCEDQFWFHSNTATTLNKVHKAEITCLEDRDSIQVNFECEHEESSSCETYYPPKDKYLLALWMPQHHASAQITSFNILFSDK